MTGVDEQLDLFSLIGRQLKKKVDCYVIGGSAMFFYGFKSATKDIDLIFTNEAGRKEVASVLKEIGFAQRAAISNKSPLMFGRKEESLDLFLSNIITTIFSPGMASRVKEKHEFSNLVVNVVSPEDIIVLKCATDREGDRKDAADMIKSVKINWDVILEEARWQATNGKRAFVIFLFDFVEDLRRDYKADIPQSFTNTLRKEYKDNLVKLLGYKKYKELGGE